MRILLVYLNVNGRAFYPISVSMLQGYIKAKGHDTDVFDTTFYENMEYAGQRKVYEKLGCFRATDLTKQGVSYSKSSVEDDFINKIDLYKPDLVAFNALSINFPLGVTLSRLLKSRYQIPIIFGGPHTNVAPLETISEESIDMVCLGEGEAALAELCDRIENGIAYNDVKNVWVKLNGKIIKNELRPFLDMDSLSPPDWSNFSDKHVFGSVAGKVYRMAPVEMSRGCPYRCTYCINSHMQDAYKGISRYNRRKSISKAVYDIKYLRDKYDIEMFYFLDETFLHMKYEYLLEFSKAYISEINRPFFIQTHPQSVSKDKVKILKDMSCTLISMGIEHGDYDIRKNILNRSVKDETIIESYKIIREAQIRSSAFNLIGVPTEDRKKVFKTIELNKKCQPDSMSLSFLFPFKGTKIREMVIQEGLATDDIPDAIDVSTGSALKLPNLSEKELKGLFKTFYIYYRSPRFLYPLIRLCEYENIFSNTLFKLIVKWYRRVQKNV